MAWEGNNQREQVIDEQLLRGDENQHHGKPSKILAIPLKLLIAVFLIGALFKLQHYPGADVLLSIGLLGIAALYPVRFARKSSKRVKDYIKVLFVVVFAVWNWINLMHIPFPVYFRTGLNIILWALLLSEGFDFFYFKNWEYPRPVWLLVPVIAGILIGVGMYFKLHHNPYAAELLITGLVSMALWFSKDAFLFVWRKVFKK